MIHVSIAEDLPEIRRGIEWMIEKEPDLVLASSSANGTDAAKDIVAAQPDVVIMDIDMPGMNGIECIERIVANCPKTQFMIFTVYENDEKIFDAIAAGASGYLLKKTTSGKMVEAIRELHNGGSPMSPMIARKVLGHFKQEKTDGLKELSPKQNEILNLLAKGFLYKEIADKLSIVPGTVTQHIHKIYERLHVANRTEAINKLNKH